MIISGSLDSTPTSAKLSDPTGLWGARDRDTLTILLPNDSPVTLEGNEYSFEVEATFGQFVEYCLECFINDSTVYYNKIVQCNHLELELTEDNSYITLEEADIFAATKLDPTLWFQADEQSRIKAILQAMKRIDSLRFIEEPESDTQLLAFPRTVVGLPKAIKEATFELAFALLSGAEVEEEYRSLDVSSSTFGSVSTTYRPKNYAHVIAGIPCYLAWILLLPYIDDDNSISLCKG